MIMRLRPRLQLAATACLLLAIPVLGPILMVPAASLGGVWLVCRLDKGFLRYMRSVR